MSGENVTESCCGTLLDADQLGYAAEMLKMLAHPLRLQIVQLLRDGSLPVKDLVEKTGSPQATVSGYLRKMKLYGLVESTQRGQEVWYGIKNECVISLLVCICNYYDNQKANRGIEE